MKKGLFTIGAIALGLVLFSCSDSKDCECTAVNINGTLTTTTVLNEDTGDYEEVETYVYSDSPDPRNFLLTDYEGICTDFSDKDIPAEWRHIISDTCRITCSEK
ncbi:MAG: hypothetical protein IJ748_04150 [Bacteroidales bacterium]|nr:hypothetical protein [Bacteroidales bacterium]